MVGPKVVALGGGHGLAVALRAVRRYAGDVTAIVSVADDGGSSGRLRRDLDVPAPGDLRHCLVALAADESAPWPAAFEHRFASGELAGHALGNLILVGLAETLGDLTAALDEAGRLLGTAGRVLPATTGPASLRAQVGERTVIGQVAIAAAGRHDRIRAVCVDPPTVAATPAALAAIAAADQIVVAPGSLFTSIVAVLAVPAIREAVAAAAAPVVQVANLATEDETTGLDGTAHLGMVLAHGGRVDMFLYDPAFEGPAAAAGGRDLAVDAQQVAALGVRPVAAPLCDPAGTGHDPVQLAQALSALL